MLNVSIAYKWASYFLEIFLFLKKRFFHCLERLPVGEDTHVPQNNDMTMLQVFTLTDKVKFANMY